jgi:hypothetical protein
MKVMLIRSALAAAVLNEYCMHDNKNRTNWVHNFSTWLQVLYNLLYTISGQQTLLLNRQFRHVLMVYKYIDCCCIQYNIQHSPLTTVTTATLQHRGSFINSSNSRITLHSAHISSNGHMAHSFGNYFYNKVGCKTSKLLRYLNSKVYF